jgi:glycosyl transferase family 25
MTTWNIQSIPSFCITLERRKDRWKRFQDQPGINGLQLRRFIGVDGKTLDVDKDNRITILTKRNIKAKKRRSHEELDSIGGVGCALSHIAVWQWIVDNKQDMCLIFEDDAVVPPNFIDEANKYITNSMLLGDPRTWDIWLLGGKWDDLTTIPGEFSRDGIVRIGSFVLFHAYVMTLQCARKLLRDVYPIHAHIDIWVSIYAHLNDIRIVGTTKLILQQNQKATTDIQSNDGCAICNVPTNYNTTYKMVSHTEWHIAKTSEIICIGLLCYMAYQYYK